MEKIFFHKSLRENPNELFGQPSIWPISREEGVSVEEHAAGLCSQAWSGCIISASIPLVSHTGLPGWREGWEM